MTPADLDLARRIAAVPGIWRRGMTDTLGRTVLAVDGEALLLAWPEGADQPTGDWFSLAGMAPPDLDDAATRGALLDVARETWGRPDLHACPMFSLHTGALTSWRVAIDEYTAHYAPTEGAAIAQAILAAPTLATTPPPTRSPDGYAKCKHCGGLILLVDGPCPGCKRHPFLP